MSTATDALRAIIELIQRFEDERDLHFDALLRKIRLEAECALIETEKGSGQ